MKHSVSCLVAMAANILWLLAASFTVAALVYVLSVIEKVSRRLRIGATGVSPSRILPTLGQ